MALPTSGPLTLAQIQTEFGGSNPISLNEYYAGGANVPAGTSGTNGPVPSSGQIAISNFYGTQKNTRVTLSYAFSAPAANASLNLSSIGGYSAGQSDITVTVNSGVYLYATSTGSYGLNLSGGTTGDTLVLVNNGYIMGQGGNGGQDVGPARTQATPGGPALNLGFGMSACTINNTNGSAYIGGGGGGGAFTWRVFKGTSTTGGGGGAGGGRGGDFWSAPVGPLAGGAGGGIGSSGSNGSTPPGSDGYGRGGGAGGGAGAATRTVAASPLNGAGGGGGRIFPGSGGASGAPAYNGAGGSGNAGGQTGIYNISQGQTGTSVGGGGGGWGASGGLSPIQPAATAGSGGKAVNVNGKTITWTSGDTARVYGSVS